MAHEISKRRKRAVEDEFLKAPLLAYSYSSRGFPDIKERFHSTRQGLPTFLISLYDLRYNIVKTDPPGWANTRLRFLDSGTYEVADDQDALRIEGAAGIEMWSQDLYLETARAEVQPGDVLVSFDGPNTPIRDQLRQALGLFAELPLDQVKREVLLHTGDASPEEVVAALEAHLDDFEILGLTEKDVAVPWFLGVAYVRELRARLDSLARRYVPIHLFGCLDPQNVPYYFFAGADVFDGLAWMRHYFHGGHAYYVREFEHRADPTVLLDPRQATLALLRNNVSEMERLRSDLQYAILTRDFERFGGVVGKLSDLM